VHVGEHQGHPLGDGEETDAVPVPLARVEQGTSAVAVEVSRSVGIAQPLRHRKTSSESALEEGVFTEEVGVPVDGAGSLGCFEIDEGHARAVGVGLVVAVLVLEDLRQVGETVALAVDGHSSGGGADVFADVLSRTEAIEVRVAGECELTRNALVDVDPGQPRVDSGGDERSCEPVGTAIHGDVDRAAAKADGVFLGDEGLRVALDPSLSQELSAGVCSVQGGSGGRRIGE
jgi:hypothetical protein